MSYAERIDAGDLDGVAALFAHAHVALVGAQRSRSGAPPRCDGPTTACSSTTACPATRHVVTNLVVELEPPDRAQARSTFTVFQARPDFPLQPIICGRYHDTFERVAGAWRFADRLIVPELIGGPEPPPRARRLGAALGGEADRHPLDAVDEVRAQALDGTGHLDVGHAAQQLLEHHPDLEAREVGAETEVRVRCRRRGGRWACGRRRSGPRPGTRPRRGSPRRRTGRACRPRGCAGRGPRRRASPCAGRGSPASPSAASPRPPSAAATGRPAVGRAPRDARSARAGRRRSGCGSSRCRRPGGA